MFSSLGYDIIGVAGFGLSSFSSGADDVVAPLANGAYVSHAHAFQDNFGSLDTNSNSWDIVVDGSGSVATTTNGLVTSSSGDLASTAHPLCNPSCDFTAGAAPILETGTDPMTSSAWARFGSGYTAAHTDIAAVLNDIHVISTTDTTSVLPTGVLGTYTRSGTGATTPTWNFGPAGSSYEEATSSLHTITLNFVNGARTVSHDFTFPSGTVNLVGGDTATLSPQMQISYSGDISGAGPDNCTGCVFGHDHFHLVGSGAEYIVGSGQFNSSGGPTDKRAGAFTYILPGSFVAFP